MNFVNNFHTKETIKIWLSNAEKTAEFGSSLTNTFYKQPLTILLDGPLGAGKTTLLQGLAKALGITEPVTSPTYALEQRYPLSDKSEFLHLDLYRLEPDAARALLASAETEQGIRCIEWAEKVEGYAWNGPTIRITLAEEGDGRSCTVSFEDIAMPTDEQIIQWRSDVLLPQNIIDHCEAVARVCDACAENLLSRGIAVRPLALHRSAQLHDLLRFIDFKSGAAPADAVRTEEQEALWSTLRATHAARHEDACVEFLNARGFPAIAHIVETHGLTTETRRPRTGIEQKILFYADKRAVGDQIVTVNERFADFEKRYGNGTNLAKGMKWLEETRVLERELFPDAIPLQSDK